MAVPTAFDSIYHTAQSTRCSCSIEPTCIPQKSARSSCPDGEELYRSDRQADPYLPALVRSPCCSLHHLKNCECLTDHTLAHPLNCRGGVMAHPSAYCCTQVLNPGLTREGCVLSTRPYRPSAPAILLSRNQNQIFDLAHSTCEMASERKWLRGIWELHPIADGSISCQAFL